MLNSYLPATVEDSFGLPGKRKKKKTANKQTKKLSDNNVIDINLSKRMFGKIIRKRNMIAITEKNK